MLIYANSTRTLQTYIAHENERPPPDDVRHVLRGIHTESQVGVSVAAVVTRSAGDTDRTAVIAAGLMKNTVILIGFDIVDDRHDDGGCHHNRRDLGDGTRWHLTLIHDNRATGVDALGDHRATRARTRASAIETLMIGAGVTLDKVIEFGLID